MAFTLWYRTRARCLGRRREFSESLCLCQIRSCYSSDLLLLLLLLLLLTWEKRVRRIGLSMEPHKEYLNKECPSTSAHCQTPGMGKVSCCSVLCHAPLPSPQVVHGSGSTCKGCHVILSTWYCFLTTLWIVSKLPVPGSVCR